MQTNFRQFAIITQYTSDIVQQCTSKQWHPCHSSITQPTPIWVAKLTQIKTNICHFVWCSSIHSFPSSRTTQNNCLRFVSIHWCWPARGRHMFLEHTASKSIFVTEVDQFARLGRADGCRYFAKWGTPVASPMLCTYHAYTCDRPQSLPTTPTDGEVASQPALATAQDFLVKLFALRGANWLQ